MSLTREQYEIMMLDYLEGNLSEEKSAILLAYLEEHPELKADLHVLSGSILDIEEISYPDKEALLIKPAASRSILPFIYRYSAIAAVMLLLITALVWMNNGEDSITERIANLNLEQEPIQSPIDSIQTITPNLEVVPETPLVAKSEKDIETPKRKIISPRKRIIQPEPELFIVEENDELEREDLEIQNENLHEQIEIKEEGIAEDVKPVIEEAPKQDNKPLDEMPQDNPVEEELFAMADNSGGDVLASFPVPKPAAKFIKNASVTTGVVADALNINSNKTVEGNVTRRRINLGPVSFYQKKTAK